MAKGIAAKTDFDPALYEYVGSFYCGTDEEMAYEYQGDHDALARIMGETAFEALTETAGQCESCGTRYSHGTVVDGPEGRFPVGHICGTEYFGLPSVYAFRAKEAAKAKERAARKAEAEAFVIEHDLAPVMAHNFTGNPVDHPRDGSYFEGWGGGTAYDILRKLFVYGSLSPKQVDLLKKIHSEHHERQEEKAAEPKAVAIPDAIVGVRSTIEGTILGTKVQDGVYGSTLKMLVAVEHDGGRFKLWGTVPSKGLDRYDDDGYLVEYAGKGHAIKFDAKVERSSDDEAFGFFSRPTKAERLDA